MRNTPQVSPDQSAHFSRHTRAEKGRVEKPTFHNISDNLQDIDFSPAVSNRWTHDTDTQQDRPRRACAITTGSERVRCGTHHEPSTEEDTSFKKLFLQNPSVTIVLLPPRNAHSVRIPKTPNYSELQIQKTHCTNAVQDSAKRSLINIRRRTFKSR